MIKRYIDAFKKTFTMQGRSTRSEFNTFYFGSIVIAFIPALYMVTILRYAFIVGLAIFVIFYWAIDIIMNNILIYLGKYEIEEIE